MEDDADEEGRPTPWKVESTRVIIKDRWIDLRADDCVRPDGVRISPYYVLHYPEWVHVLCRDEADRICLVDQYRHGARRGVRELPGGMLEQGESPLDGAKRELGEETGLVGERWQALGAFSPNPATHTNNIHIFACRVSGDVNGAVSTPDPTEELRSYFADWQVVCGYIEDGSFAQLSHLGILFRATMLNHSRP